MKKMLPLLLVIAITMMSYACSKTHTGPAVAGWVGDYTYNEDPVPTSTGINQIMQWELHVFEQGDTCWGILEITGLRTYVKLLTVLSGDSSHVDVAYYKYLDGDSAFRQGELLFSLSKENNHLMTTWNILQPRLSDYAEEKGACFKPKKKQD